MYFRYPSSCLFGLALLAAHTTTSAFAAESAVPLIITHASLWTADGTVADQEILVRDGHVAAVGKSGTLERPNDARVLDAKGDTLLPGLIDAHVHLSFGARLPPDLAKNPQENVYPIAAKQLLRSGVTTGRIHLWDLPSASAFCRAAADNAFPSPRLKFGGPGFMGGHPEWDTPKGNVWGVKSADDAAQKVQQLKDAGAEWIALHDLKRFQPGEVDAIIKAARQAGLRIMIAGDSIAAVEQAVALDADSIEYIDFSATPRYPAELLARLKEAHSKLTLVPMPGNRYRLMAYRHGEMSLDDAWLTEFMPPAAATFAIDALREDRTKENGFTRQFDAAFPTLAEKFKQLRDTGLPVAIGTDCGSPAHLHSDAIWWEMETWRKFGIAPDEIVRAATVIPAKLLDDSSIGHLSVGARADFVMYRGKIEDTPFSVTRVRSVAKGGVLFLDEGEWHEPRQAP